MCVSVLCACLLCVCYSVLCVCVLQCVVCVCYSVVPQSSVTETIKGKRFSVRIFRLDLKFNSVQRHSELTRRLQTSVFVDNKITALISVPTRTCISLPFNQNNSTLTKQCKLCYSIALLTCC